MSQLVSTILISHPLPILTGTPSHPHQSFTSHHPLSPILTPNPLNPHNPHRYTVTSGVLGRSPLSSLRLLSLWKTTVHSKLTSMNTVKRE